ncbi:MAG TPA: dihydrofolate reductase family protein [Chloroflexota bacterium]|jgi:riboflavin biosynthesis pyrimidine reductase
MPLPAALASLYGQLRLPVPAERPYIAANFVTTLDGVVSLNVPGHSGGGPISGFNQHDRMVMGLLRAVADAVIVGAGTVRDVSRDHRWTAAYIYPPLADEYQKLRISMGRPDPPLTVIVTASGDIDRDLAVFQSGEAPVLIVTTEEGARRIGDRGLPASVRLATARSAGRLHAQEILDAVRRVHASSRILVEGGPRLLGDFMTEGCLDELFLTLAPQVAGRDDATTRPGLIAGHKFAPGQPLWGTLMGVKRAGNHLFLRYAFAEEE